MIYLKLVLPLHSVAGEKSYSHHSSTELGLSVIDRFTYHALMFFEHITGPREKATMQNLFDHFKCVV